MVIISAVRSRCKRAQLSQTDIMEKNMTGKIYGTGSWAPPKVWDNNDLARMVETSDEWIRERTGVVQRHIAEENEDTVTMASRAAQRALKMQI